MGISLRTLLLPIKHLPPDWTHISNNAHAENINSVRGNVWHSTGLFYTQLETLQNCQQTATLHTDAVSHPQIQNGNDLVGEAGSNFAAILGPANLHKSQWVNAGHVHEIIN